MNFIFCISNSYELSSRLYFVVNYQLKCVICVKRFVQNQAELKKTTIEYIKIVSGLDMSGTTLPISKVDDKINIFY
jgi:hypothetical protein